MGGKETHTGSRHVEYVPNGSGCGAVVIGMALGGVAEVWRLELQLRESPSILSPRYRV